MNTDEKKHYLTLYANSLIDQAKKDNQTNWIEDYAKEFVDVWGKTEAQRQIRAMNVVNDQERRFCAVVAGFLNGRE